MMTSSSAQAGAQASGLSPLTQADIPEIMRLERMPGYDSFVGRWEMAEHIAEMESPDARYFGLRDATGLAGYAMLQNLRRPTVVLRRIVVHEPGRGLGTRLLRGVMAWVFETTTADALELDVRLGNLRARHVYEREGFVRFASDEVQHFLAIARAAWVERR